MTINAGANCQATIPDLTPQVVASDDSGSVTIAQSPVAGTLVGLGDTVVTITVSDAASNQTTCQATITVVDVTPPVITTCATNMTHQRRCTNCQAAIPDLTIAGCRQRYVQRRDDYPVAGGRNAGGSRQHGSDADRERRSEQSSNLPGNDHRR
jgi:hypothetical protein